MLMQHGCYMPRRMFRVIGVMRPCVDAESRGVLRKVENFYDSIPNRLALELFKHGNARNVF